MLIVFENMRKILLYTMAVGEDLIYFKSVNRYFPYNKKYFGQNYNVDYLLFTDGKDEIKGMQSIPCETFVWPYVAMLKNNILADYLDEKNQWEKYEYIYFIDADFAIGDYYDFFDYDFLFIKPDWNSKIAGGFYGGKAELFYELCKLFYDEKKYIYENKLPPPYNLDEFYLSIFYEKHKQRSHLIEMTNETRLVFYDNENLDKKISVQGNKLFMQPYKAKGRANKTILIDSLYKEIECIVNLKEQYIFNNLTYDFGRLLKLDKNHYRIFWAKEPEKREVLNIQKNQISNKITTGTTQYFSPAISVVMSVYNTRVDYLKDSIESVLSQSFDDFEFIIIDDGSTDFSCVKHIKSYKDSRIKLIENHHDFIDSLNKGIEASKGKYIARMDSDDIMMPNRLQVQWTFMEDNPDIAVCGSWAETFENQKRNMTTVENHNEIISNLILCNSIINPTTMLRRKTVFVEGDYLYKKGYPYAEDYKLWVDLAMGNCRFYNIPQILLRYRISVSQVTHKYSHEMSHSALLIKAEYAEFIMEELGVENEYMFNILDNLISLFNEGFIHVHIMYELIYKLYVNHLTVKDQSLGGVMLND